MPDFLETSFFPLDGKPKVRAAPNHLRLAEPVRECEHPDHCMSTQGPYRLCAKCLTLFQGDEDV